MRLLALLQSFYNLVTSALCNVCKLARLSTTGERLMLRACVGSSSALSGGRWVAEAMQGRLITASMAVGCQFVTYRPPGLTLYPFAIELWLC